MSNKFEIIETPDYYLAVSDEEIKEGDYQLVPMLPLVEKATKENIHLSYMCYKIIAYLPKGDAKELNLPLLPDVENDVEGLPYDKLCYYDTRNPYFQVKEEYCYDAEEVAATGEFPKKDCACDNCFYGRAKLADRIIKSATKIYSEEDVEKLAESYYTQIKLTERTAFKFGYKAATKVYSEDDLRKAINMARGIKEGKETFTAEDISGCTEVCTYDWKFEFDEDEIIQSLKQPKTPKWFVVEIEEWLDQTYSEHGCYRQKLKTTTINGKTYLVGTYE